MKKANPILILLFLFSLSSPSLIAQRNQGSKRASETRAAKQKALRDAKIFGKSDKEFENTKTPEKWEDESAVVLARKIEYIYANEKKEVTFEKIYRSRVKLLDQAAVELYSEFYFIATNEIGIRIIKPDGETEIVETDQAVEVENSVKIPKEFFSLKVKYKKLAVPNLEVGDIIDYYYHYYETQVNYEEHAFEPIIFTLAGNFPFVYQKIDFQVKFRGFYINFNSYNGASPLIETNNSETRTKTFSFTDTDREKLESTRFLFKYLTEPTIKFQVIYSSPKFKKTSKNFLGEIGVPKSHVTEKELKEYVNRISLAHNAEGIDSYVTSNYLKLLRKYRKKDISKRRFLQDAYDAIQVNTLLAGGYDNLSYSMNDEYFVAILKNLLDQKDIKNEIVVAIRRSTGSIDNLLLTEELIWLLKVNIGKSVYYIFTPDIYSSIDDRYSSAEGVEAYAVTSDKNQRNLRISKIKLPTSSHTENTISKSYEVGLTDMSIMDIESTTSVKGISKYDYFSSALIYDDYVPVKLKKSEINEFPITKNKGKIEEQKRKIKDRIAEDEKERKETYESLREQTFTVTSYDDFQLLNNGLSKKNDSLVFFEKFSIEDLVKKAGPNYLIEVGKFIGNQIELKEKETVRTKDIWIGFAATYSYELSFTVPDGYQLQGIDKLSMNVENETGGFVSVAELEGNILKVKTKKFYKNIFEPKENWDKMMEFIEAAYDFTQIKLLMKKG